MPVKGRSAKGNPARGEEVMRRLWGAQFAGRLRSLWRSLHPDVERYITGFAMGEVWARPTLDLKTRCLICLAGAVALERENQVRLHTRGALRSGATPAEVAETIIQLMIYAGFPAAWQALVYANEVITEESRRPAARRTRRARKG
jgi:alkylhydroperoxidase/carboxymuconolactone decarboxylase family protein YurZ